MSAQSATSSRFSGRTVTAPLPVRPRPRTGPWVPHQADDGRTVMLHPSVLATVRSIERTYTPDETGGLLFGRVFVDSEGEYAVVSFAEAPGPGEVRGGISTVQITAQGAEAMAERAHAQCFEADLVGWYHTHPSFEAYFSGTDRAEQATWSSALAVGLVVSGVVGRNEPYKVYVGPDSTETRILPGLSQESCAVPISHHPTTEARIAVTGQAPGPQWPPERRSARAPQPVTAPPVGTTPREHFRPSPRIPPATVVPSSEQPGGALPAGSIGEPTSAWNGMRTIIAIAAVAVAAVILVLAVAITGDDGPKPPNTYAPPATRTAPPAAKPGDRETTGPKAPQPALERTAPPARDQAARERSPGSAPNGSGIRP